jgi:cysteine desulfuration protein SufE
MSGLDALAADFDLLGDWEERYRHLIEIGGALAPLTDEEHSPAHKVRGCASQVWLVSEAAPGADPVLRLRGDSDAHIVRGLIALLIALYSERSGSEILAIDARREFARLGLESHLSQQRSNGLYAMVTRIREEAARALGGAHAPSA